MTLDEFYKVFARAVLGPHTPEAEIKAWIQEIQDNPYFKVKIDPDNPKWFKVTVPSYWATDEIKKIEKALDHARKLGTYIFEIRVR